MKHLSPALSYIVQHEARSQFFRRMKKGLFVSSIIVALHQDHLPAYLNALGVTLGKIVDLFPSFDSRCGVKFSNSHESPVKLSRAELP